MSQKRKNEFTNEFLEDKALGLVVGPKHVLAMHLISQKVLCLNLLLFSQVQEWRQRAVSSESKTNELEAKISVLYGDLESLRKEKNAVQGTKCSPIPLDSQNELEKRIVVCCSKENNNVTESSKHNEVLSNGERKAHATRGGFLAPKRSPFQDIGNSSLLMMKQNGKAVFPLHCHLSSNVQNGGM